MKPFSQQPQGGSIHAEGGWVGSRRASPSPALPFYADTLGLRDPMGENKFQRLSRSRELSYNPPLVS